MLPLSTILSAIRCNWLNATQSIAVTQSIAIATLISGLRSLLDMRRTKDKMGRRSSVLDLDWS